MTNRSFKVKPCKKARLLPILMALLLLISLVGMTSCDVNVWVHMLTEETEAKTEAPTLAIPSTEDESEDIGKKEENAEISVHVIDVGQGDAILIMTEAGNMLIDSGDLGNAPREKLVSYLASKNITSFEYVVFTHTDADHIGSADYVIENYNVKTVIMPDYQATTKVFSRLIEAMEAKETDLILIGEDTEACEQFGYSFTLGPITHTVMAPTEDFKDPNEMSVVIKSVYGETSILFTGDAEKKSEAAMVEKYTKGELDCDILKVGHHGSDTSTSDEFLAAVSPEVALISCGEGNKYGHPKSVIVDKLENADVDIYRTDTDGSVVITTDGVTYKITKEK